MVNLWLYGWFITTLESFLFFPCFLLMAAACLEARRCARAWLFEDISNGAELPLKADSFTERELIQMKMNRMETLAEHGQIPQAQQVQTLGLPKQTGAERGRPLMQRTSTVSIGEF